MTKGSDWPVEGAKGPALDKHEVADMLGIGVPAINQAQKRTRAGLARVPFPEPSGIARRERRGTSRWASYWYATDVRRYGRKAGHLDGKGQLVAKAEPAKVA